MNFTPCAQRMIKSIASYSLLAVGAGAILVLSGCKSAPPPPPQAAVSVVKPLFKEVTDFDEYTGRLESPEMVLVAARVGGIVMRADFAEGALVKEGDVLFEIDERPFKAEADSKEADVAKANSLLSVAQAQLDRYQTVKGTQAISAQDYDQAVALVQQGHAQVEGAKAALAIAKLNLEWTKVTAPIAGRVGKKLVTEGNLVNGGAGVATQLTSIASVDPMYSYINVPERSFLRYQPLAAARGSAALPCAAQLENEKIFSHQGKIDFVDNHIDPATGTIQMRCTISNNDGSLTPGLFVRTRVEASNPYQATLVPDLAIGTDQNMRFILVVGSDGTVKNEPVKLGSLFGKLRVITAAVTSDTMVVVNGLQSARPGAKVTATELQLSPEGEIIVPTPSPAPAPSAEVKK